MNEEGCELLQNRQEFGSDDNRVNRVMRTCREGILAGLTEGASFAMHQTTNGEIKSGPALMQEIGASPQSIDHRSR